MRRTLRLTAIRGRDQSPSCSASPSRVSKLGEGVTVEELLGAYPRLSREDIQAALAYAGSGSLSP